MKLLRIALPLGGALIGMAIAAGGADSLEAVFAKMDAAAANFKGLMATVRKVSHTAVIDEDSVDTGTIAVKRPKPHDVRMVMQTDPPHATDAEFAGTKARIYYPAMNTVQEWNLGKNKALVDQFLLLGFGSNSTDLERAYSITPGGPETVAGQKTTRIVLVPKDAELRAHFPKFELWVSDDTGLVVQQKFYEPGGDYIMTTYSNLKPAPNLPDSALTLHIPKGAKVEHPQK